MKNNPIDILLKNNDFDRLVFYMLMFINLFPILFFRYFPSQDGPSHLYNANILLHLYFFKSVFYHTFYFVRFDNFTNIISEISLSALLFIFPPYIAEKILLSSYIICYPLSFRYLIKTINPNNLFLSYFGLILVNNMFLYLGFYNFIFSLIFFNLALGYFLHNFRDININKIIILNVLSLIIIFFHIFTFYLLCITLSSVLLALIFNYYYRYFNNIVPNDKFPLKDTILLPSLGLFLPTVYASFYLYNFNQSNKLLAWIPISKRFIYLIGDISLIYYSRFQYLFSAIVLSLLLIMIYFRDKEPFNDCHNSLKAFQYGFLITGIIYCVLIMVMPDMIGEGGVITSRMVIFFYVNIMLLLAFNSYKDFTLVLTKIMLIIIIISLNIFNFIKINEFNKCIKEYVSVEKYIKPYSIVLPICFQPIEFNGKILSNYVDPFLHASDYIAVDNNIITLDNYEAGMTNIFPTHFYDDMNPYKIIGNIYYGYNIFNIKSYVNKTGYDINYIITCGSEKFIEKPGITTLQQQLRKYYKLIVTSQSGFTKLYVAHSNE